ncbi:MAG: 16S rRNA (cytidine(1402)-2'-O)-methyltransferase, partial [Pseudomonadota bacterium]
YYESPYRLAALISDAYAVFGDRPCAIARELTKTHEEIKRGSLAMFHEEMRDTKRLLGETVLLIACKTD